MSALHCLACAHQNLRGEKFCQACGSTLDLKLCKQCEAINESNAHACHKCGTQFASLRLPRARTAAIAAGMFTVLAVIGFAYQFSYRQPVAAVPDVGRQSAIQPVPPQPVATRVEDKATPPTAPEKKKPATPIAAPDTSGARRTAVTHPDVARQSAIQPVPPQPVANRVEDKATPATAPEKKKPATPVAAPDTSGATRTAVTHTRP